MIGIILPTAQCTPPVVVATGEDALCTVLCAFTSGCLYPLCAWDRGEESNCHCLNEDPTGWMGGVVVNINRSPKQPTCFFHPQPKLDILNFYYCYYTFLNRSHFLPSTNPNPSYPLCFFFYILLLPHNHLTPPPTINASPRLPLLSLSHAFQYPILSSPYHT